MDPVSTISKIFMLREHWIPDHKAQSCFSCKSSFGFFIRRHHCRMCGNVFDTQCADNYVEPPLFIYETEKKIRLCKSCFAIISRDMRNDRLTNYKGAALNFYLTPAQTLELEKCVNSTLVAKWTDLSKKVLSYMLNENGLYDTWFDKLVSIVEDSVETVQPCTLANDDIDITRYIKVKAIPYVDNSLTRLVRGVVLRKNFTSKKMTNEHYDATVLMLKGSVEKTNSETQVLESEAINAESIYLENIINKILELNPSVVIIEGNIGRKFQEALFKAGKALMIRLRKGQFEKIRRITMAKPIQDLDKLQTADISVLGTCMNLYVQNYQNKELYEEVKKFRPDDIYGTFDPSLMFIESNYPEKGATILLSGPKYQELQLVKKSLQETFRILRNLFLENSIISQEIFMFHTKERLWELMANNQPSIRTSDNYGIREKLALESYQNSDIEEISLTSCLLNQNTAASVGYMLSYLTERTPIDRLIRTCSVDFTKFVLVPMKFICFPDLLNLNSQQIAKIEEELRQSCCWHKDEFSQMEKFPQLLKIYFYNKEDMSLGSYLWNKYMSVS